MTFRKRPAGCYAIRVSKESDATYDELPNSLEALTYNIQLLGGS
jgi:hypothetical protein